MNKNEIKRLKKGLDLINLMISKLEEEKTVNVMFDFRSAIYYLFYRGEELREEFLFYIPVDRLEYISNVLLTIRSSYGSIKDRGEIYLKAKAGVDTLSYVDLILSLKELKGYLEEILNRHNFKIFYSWQSDTDNTKNRSFIEDVLEKVIKSIAKEKELPLVLDKDTRQITGAPDISATILSKIENCFVFVADVTLTTTDESIKKQMPNGNVLYESGYAEGVLNESNILLVCNIAYGDITNLPFDLRGKRIIKYNCPKSINSEDKKKVKEALQRDLKREIELICREEIV